MSKKRRESKITTKVLPIARMNYRLAKQDATFRDGYLNKVKRLGNVKNISDIEQMLFATEDHIQFLTDTGCLINT